MANRDARYIENLAGGGKDWRLRCERARGILLKGLKDATEEERELVRQVGREAVALYRASATA